MEQGATPEASRPIMGKSGNSKLTLNRDRKILIFTLIFIYATVLIPIGVFVKQMITRVEIPYELMQPDLFKELNPVDESDPEQDALEKAAAERERRRAISEAEKLALKQFQERKDREWRESYFSPRCERHKEQPAGLASEGKRGMGRRAYCTSNMTTDSEEYLLEGTGSVEVSIPYRTIYVPVVKSASSVIQDTMRKRLRSKRIADRNVLLFLKSKGLSLSDFFVFTFVRDPFQVFQSAYREANKYEERNKTIDETTFMQIENKPENEPRRAIASLMDARNGLFIPTHMYTQFWKVQRCTGKQKEMIEFNFIGHIDDMDDDWKFIEMKLGLPHRPLPSRTSGKPQKSKLTFDPVTDFDSPWSMLTKHVCDYYQSDFDCFGFNRTLCQS